MAVAGFVLLSLVVSLGWSKIIASEESASAQNVSVVHSSHAITDAFSAREIASNIKFAGYYELFNMSIEGGYELHYTQSQ